MTPMRCPRRFALTMLMTVAGLAAVAPAALAAEIKHKSGISLVGPGPYQAIPKSETEARAHDRALRAARENPADFGYPWLSHGALVQRHLTAKGKSLSAKVKSAVPHREEAARRSYAELERIKGDIMMLEKVGVTDADALISAEPDDEHNRIIVTVQRLSDGLMSNLAGLYGTEAIAVRVDPQARRPDLLVGGRDNDSPPYSGGAQYITPSGTPCTLGFPWTTGFITAAHCVHQGGTSTSPSSGYIGVTEATKDENWDRSTGTTSFPGESTDRGDIAIIRTPSSDFISPEIYVGPAGSTLKRGVGDLWDTSPRIDELYCTGGHKTGELCNWRVIATRQNVYYSTSGATAWNVTIGTRDGQNLIGGDSGGPVYTVRADGTVAAKGIISGSGAYSGTYRSYFTDLLLAEAPFGGTLKTIKTSVPFLILNGNSSKCLAIGNGSKLNGAYAIQWNCTGSAAQQWYWEPHPTAPYAIRIINGSGKCLAIGSSSTANGAKAIQWDCINSSSGQTWYFGANDSIVNNSGKCLAIGSGSLVDGANAIQWDCLGSPAQKWYWYPF